MAKKKSSKTKRKGKVQESVSLGWIWILFGCALIVVSLGIAVI